MWKEIMGLDVNKEMSKRNTKLYDCLNSTYGDYLTIMVNQIFTKLPTAAANVLFIFLIWSLKSNVFVADIANETIRSNVKQTE